MRKSIILLNLLLFSFGWAQWSDNYEENTLVASGPTGDIQSLGTNDGKTYVVFWDESDGYELRAQLLDAEGNLLWGENGISVNGSAVNSTWTATRSEAVDEAGNLYIGFTATGDGNGYINKISPEGEYLFGEEGIAIPEAWDMKILATQEGELIVGWYENGSGMLMLYDQNGQEAWESPIEVQSPDSSQPFTSIGELSLLSDGSFVAIIHVRGVAWTIDSTPYAQRFNLDGTMVWENFTQLSNRTLAYNRRYQVIQDGDVTYFGYYGTVNTQFDSYIQRINPDGTTPWGLNGADFSTDDTYMEMTTSIALEEGADVVWAMSNFTNSNQNLYGHYVQKFDKSTGERLLGDSAKEIFPVNSEANIGLGNLQLVDGKPLFLFSNGISNGVNSIQLGVVLLDENGDFVWEDESEFIATSPGSKGRVDFTQNVNGQSVAIWTEERNGTSNAYAQNFVVEQETAGTKELEEIKIEVYPNPTNGIVHLKLSTPIKSAEVLSLSGQLLISLNKVDTIDLSFLNSGIYVLKLETQDGRVKTTRIAVK